MHRGEQKCYFNEKLVTEAFELSNDIDAKNIFIVLLSHIVIKRIYRKSISFIDMSISKRLII